MIFALGNAQLATSTSPAMQPFGLLCDPMTFFSFSFIFGLDFRIAKTAVALLLPGHVCCSVLSAPVAFSDAICLGKHQLGFRFALLEVCEEVV